MENLYKISEIIKSHKSFIIASHKNPDGDTIGANFALSESLSLMGKEVLSYCEHEIPSDFRYLLHGGIKFTSDLEKVLKRDYDIFIVLDASDRGRVSGFDRIKDKSRITVNIDHHKTNDFFGDLNYVDSSASATSEIIFDLIRIMNFPMNLQIAKAIYTGIITDTGSFRYSNTSSKCFRIASELMEFGIDAWEIAEKIYENVPYKRIKLLSYALNSLELVADGKVAVMCIDRKVLKRFNATHEDTDGFVNYGRSIKGVELSIFVREEDDGCKLSFRSKGNVDASKLAEKFGGGGHHNAAGAFVEKPLNEVMDLIYELLKSVQ